MVKKLPSKFAVISDLHGNVGYLEKAISKLKEYDVKTLIFLGDFDTYEVLKRLRDLEKEGIKVHMILGNHDVEILRGLKGEKPLEISHGGAPLGPIIQRTIEKLKKDPETLNWWLKKVKPSLGKGGLEFYWGGTRILFYHGSPVGTATHRGFSESDLKKDAPSFMPPDAFGSLWRDILDTSLVKGSHLMKLIDWLKSERKKLSKRMGTGPILLVKGHSHEPRYFRSDQVRGAVKFGKRPFLMEVTESFPKRFEVSDWGILEVPSAEYNRLIIFQRGKESRQFYVHKL